MTNAFISRRFWLIPAFGTAVFLALILTLTLIRNSRAQTSTLSFAPGPVLSEAVVAASSLNLRTGPHVSYTAVAYLVEGQRVQVTGRNRNATWAQVELENGYRGWVNAAYLRTSTPLTQLPVVDIAVGGATALVTGEPLYVYAGPGAAYGAIGRAYPGDVLTLKGRDADAKWVYVFLPDGRDGWVESGGPYLPSVTPADLPIRRPFDDAAPADSPLYLVYSGPGYEYPVTGRVMEGQSLGISGRSNDGHWLYVRQADESRGWVNATIIRLPVAVGELPVTTSSGKQPQMTTAPGRENTPTPAMATPTVEPTITASATAEEATEPNTPTAALPTETPTAMGIEEVSPTATATATTPPVGAPPESGGVVYEKPDINSPEVAQVLPGQSVVLIGRTGDSAWAKIWLDGNVTGWIRTDQLLMDIPIDLLPITKP